MKGLRVFGFIWKANCVMLFLGMLFWGGSMLFEKIQTLLPTPPEGVKIVARTKGKAPVIKRDLVYVETLKDYRIFTVKSDVILLEPETVHVLYSNQDFGKHYPTDAAEGELSEVNLVFVSVANGEKFKLFKTDTLIKETRLARFDVEKKYSEYRRLLASMSQTNEYWDFSKNLYLVVKQDTNKDGRYGENDRMDLYLSDYNGRNLKCLLSDVKGFDVIDHHQLLIAKVERGQKVYRLYNDTTDTMDVIVSQAELNN